MQAVTLPRVVVAIAVIAAAGLALLTRTPTAELPAPGSAGAPSPADPSRPDTGREPRAAAAETAAATKLRELNAMSETFRNTTFLIAIRDAGFVCNELLGVYGGVNNSTTWTASCSEMLAYTVSVAGGGTLHVEPLLQHLDAVPFTPRGEPRELAPPPQTR